MTKKELKEIANLILKNNNPELNDKVTKAISNAVIGPDGTGETRPTLCALAFATSVYLKMCRDMIKDEEVCLADIFEMYMEILDFYCYNAENKPKDDEE